MRLVMHIGLNKAGSSFLQDALSHNGATLAREGIAYPNPIRVSASQSFRQTGNGLDLALALRRRDGEGVANAIRHIFDGAGAAETVVVSNESIFHQLIAPEAHALLRSSLANHGIEDVTYIVVFRNIFRHAVSAYCHRAGNHAVAPFHRWIEPVRAKSDDSLGIQDDRRPSTEVYEFWQEFPELVRLLQAETREQWHLLRQECGILDSLGEVLGVRLEEPRRKQSNVAMNLLEAELARQLWNVSPSIARAYRRMAKETPSSEKSADSSVRSEYYDAIGEHLDVLEASLADLYRIAGPSFGSIHERPIVELGGVRSPSGYSDQQVRALLAGVRIGRRDHAVEMLKSRTPKSLKRTLRRLLGR